MSFIPAKLGREWSVDLNLGHRFIPADRLGKTPLEYNGISSFICDLKCRLSTEYHDVALTLEQVEAIALALATPHASHFLRTLKDERILCAPTRPTFVGSD